MHIDTKKKEMIGSDVSVILNQENFGVSSENEPRFAANSIFISKNKTDLSKYNIERSISLIEKALKLNKDPLFKHEQSLFPLDEVAPTNLIKEKDEMLSLISIQPYLDRAICPNEKTYDKVEDSFNYFDHVYARHYFDGEVEELDTDTFIKMPLRATEQPEDWGGPFEVDTEDRFESDFFTTPDESKQESGLEPDYMRIVE